MEISKTIKSSARSIDARIGVTRFNQDHTIGAAHEHLFAHCGTSQPSALCSLS